MPDFAVAYADISTLSSCPMERALAPDDCDRLRRYLYLLVRTAKRQHLTYQDVSAILSSWHAANRTPCIRHQPKSVAPPGSVRDQVLQVITRDGRLTLRDIAHRTGCGLNGTKSAARYLYQRGQIRRVAPGVYEAL